MIIDKRSIKKKLKEYFKDKENILFAYIFGSYVKGDFSNLSDIDIAVYLKKGEDIFESKLRLYHDLSILLKRDIDIVILNEIKSYTLLKDILDYNILVKDSSDDSRIMFELNKHHEIIDFKVFQEMSGVG